VPHDELDSSCHIGIFNLSSVWRVTVQLAVTTAQQPQLYCLQFKSLSIAFVMDKQMPYHACLFPCPYQCGLYCRSAAGLTQHRAVCAQNPANVQASESTSGSTTGISPPEIPPPQTRTPTTHAFTPPVTSPTSHTPEFPDVGVCHGQVTVSTFSGGRETRESRSSLRRTSKSKPTTSRTRSRLWQYSLQRSFRDSKAT
jgi:hypothetical protein